VAELLDLAETDTFCHGLAEGSSRLSHYLRPGPEPPFEKADLIGLRFPLFSAARKVAQCPEYRHIVPGHPPLCDLSAFEAEHCPEIKLRLAT
jgi:hypothetical protein